MHLLLAVPLVLGDLPVHCLRHQVAGDWELVLGPTSSQRSSCGHQRPDSEEHQPPIFLSEIAEHKKVHLESPNVARTASDADGRWTMIYDEGFEVNVDGLSFFAFSRFDLSLKEGVRVNVSHCGHTQLGWYRNAERTQWGCFFAKKMVSEEEHAKLVSFAPPRRAAVSTDVPLGEQHHSSFAAELNMLQDLWTAKGHSRLMNKTLRELNAMAGFFRPGLKMIEETLAEPLEPFLGSFSGPPTLLKKQARGRARQRKHSGGMAVDELPTSWDWRSVNGQNFLDEVIDQGDCGSCYAVATARMLSARHRIRQKDPSLEAFSYSFPLHCSEYNQGCGGGYPFLVSRWSQDVGLIPHRCAAFGLIAGRCEVMCESGELQKRWRADNHHYVGGYYGAASEVEMMRELVTGGPLVASLKPDLDLMYYDGGVYKSVPHPLHSEWEPVDHAVLLVGFGEEDGVKYWLLQNSWGQEWGEDGFGRIVRGKDENGIESIVVAADVVEDKRPDVLVQFLQTL